MKRHVTLSFAFVASFLLLFSPVLFSPALPVEAQSGVFGPERGYLDQRCEPGKLCNPLISSDISVIIITILRTVAQIGFAVAAVFLVYSGFKFITAQGDTKKLQEARSNFFYTVIGLAIFLGAWAIAIIIRNTIRQVAPGVV